MISSHLCVDPNIELLNGDRICFKVRFLIDVRGRCVSSHWQLPQPGLWPTPSRTSLPELAFAIAPGRQEHSASQLTFHLHILTQMFYADCRGHDLQNLRKTARSPTTVTACQVVQQSKRPKAAQG